MKPFLIRTDAVLDPKSGKCPDNQTERQTYKRIKTICLALVFLSRAIEFMHTQCIVLYE